MAVQAPPQLLLTLLGPIEARWLDTPVALAQQTARALLAYLALEADRPHAREALAAMLWPDRPQAAAYANLRQALARLRRSFPDPSNLDTILFVTPQTLQFNSAGALVDAARFTQLLRECAEHAHLDAATCPACRERSTQAAALYRGDLLQDLSLKESQPFEEWLLVAREKLHLQALDVFHSLVESAEAVGDYAQMRFYAARQLALEPWRESAYAQVMRALAYNGQRAAALAQFEACRRVLDAEFGVAPSPELVALYEQIRADKLRRAGAEPKRLSPDAAATPPPAPTLQPADLPKAGQLEQPLTPFVGREREVAEITAWLQQAQTRLLTLLGAGGMGKTRLAYATAEALSSSFLDGVCVVSLAPLAAPDAIVPAIAAALDLRLGGSEPQQGLLRALRSKSLLLILDNFEHLLDGVRIVVELLQAAPRLKILATSREQLNVRGEQVYVVHGMDYSLGATLPQARAAPAVSLFLQSARRVRPDFQLDETRLAAVLRICQLVHGMPLGLELAAAWVEILPPQAIAAEIEQSADFLAHEWRDGPDRHRSMRGVFDSSWRLLTDAERHVFRRLAVFRGGFTYEAAQAVAEASPHLLARLLHKSLVARSEAQNGGARYEIHELLRQFAAEQLAADPDERAVVEARHSAFYLAFVAAREDRLVHHEPLEATVELRVEIDNLRQAWAWAVRALRLDTLGASAFALWQFYHYDGLTAEAERVFQATGERVVAALQAAPADEPSRQAIQSVASRLVAIHATTLSGIGDYDRARATALQAIQLGAAGVSIEGEALGNFVVGCALNLSAQFLAARPYLHKARQVACQAVPPPEQRNLLRHVAWSSFLYLGAGATMLGQFSEARQYIDAGLELCQRFGLLRGELTCLLNRADIDRDRGTLVAAHDGYAAGGRIAHRIGYRWGEGIAALELGNIARRQGEYGVAGELLSRALHRFRAIGHTLKEGTVLRHLGLLHCDLGAFATAQAWFDQARATTRSINAPDADADLDCCLATLALQQAMYEQARRDAERSLSTTREIEGLVGEIDALIVMGKAQVGLRQLPEAALCFQRALELCGRVGRAATAEEARAGLANVALLEGKHAAALAQVEGLVASLDGEARGGFADPFYVYFVCSRVFEASLDPRALPVAEAAERLVGSYANSIGDDTLRRLFLERVKRAETLLPSGGAATL